MQSLVIPFREDCGFDQQDVQAVGAVYGFQTPLVNTPSFTLFGEQEFAQMGYSVNMGVYGNDDVIVVSSVTGSEWKNPNNLGWRSFSRSISNRICGPTRSCAII